LACSSLCTKARDKLIPFKAKLTLAQIADQGERWFYATGRQPFFNYCANEHNSSQEDADRLADYFNSSIWQATISVVCERDESIAAANRRQRELATTFMSKLMEHGFSTRCPRRHRWRLWPAVVRPRLDDQAPRPRSPVNRSHDPDRSCSERVRMIIFVAVPTKGVVHQQGVLTGQLRSQFLAGVAALQQQFPDYTFVAPMIQDYALLPYMKNVDATWEVWGHHCRTLIEVSNEVWVLMYAGWSTSVGVAGEIEHATLHNKPVSYLSV
jgi:hypothetical protein